MPIYEVMFVTRAETPTDMVEKITEKVKQLITQDSGEIMLSEKWGKKKLSYEIKGCGEGNFNRIVFSLDPGKLDEMNKSLKVDEDIIRFIIVKVKASDKIMKESESSIKLEKEEDAEPSADVETAVEKEEKEEGETKEETKEETEAVPGKEE